MAFEAQKLPRSESSLLIGQAVKRLERMSLPERIQLQVKAKLLTQEQADEALIRLVEAGDPAKQVPR